MNGNLEHAIPFGGLYLDIALLKKKGYCCSQIMVKLTLRRLERENPELVRSMAALCFGSGSAEGTCGVLTGGGCALSLCLESEPDSEQPDGRLPSLLSELVQWFTARADSYGGTRCADIMQASPDQRGCLALLSATVEKVQDLVFSSAAAGEGGEHVQG